MQEVTTKPPEKNDTEFDDENSERNKKEILGGNDEVIV